MSKLGTTSLPASVGGCRNFDLRYTWIRDASFTLYALLRIGFTSEAEQFMVFLAKIIKQNKTKQKSLLFPVYTVFTN